MLETINSPRDLKSLTLSQLEDLCGEIRQTLVSTVLRQGGHLASNLGAVELTVALDYVFDPPTDKIVFDVGHQSYVHKLLTGRQAGFEHLRARGGVSGFSRIAESPFDAFSVGHASTALSAALGMARARDQMGGDAAIVAVLGDGAMTGGMCYEALDDAGCARTPLIVVLNDNQMSIARNVGAMSRRLTSLRTSGVYDVTRKALKNTLRRHPRLGRPVLRALSGVTASAKRLLLGGHWFETLGIRYLGPIDGHDLKTLIKVFRRAARAEEPVLIHVVTQKGRGYPEAEARPEAYHGVSPPRPEGVEAPTPNARIAVDELMTLAERDARVTALTAAMPGGTGLQAFAERFPDRFYDVGIAEEHMVTMAAGMASVGLRPYVGIYSTFLQRAYDQLLHDVCLESLPVTLLIDRAGLVGPDGATHHGVFDLSFLRQMPNMIVASPRDIRQLRKLIDLSLTIDQPMAIRYAREGDELGGSMDDRRPLRLGSWEELVAGEQAEILAVGRMVKVALNASVILAAKGIACGVTDARFIKPLDTEKLRALASSRRLIVTLEDNVVSGGFGSAVNEALARWELKPDVLNLGVPDRFIEHGTVGEQLQECGLTAEQVADSVLERLKDEH